MRDRIPAWMFPFVYWVHSLSLQLDFFKPWKLPRILRSIRSAAAARKRGPGEREIVFIADQPTPRDLKLSHALRQKGWRVHLLLRKIPTYFEVQPWFDRVETYRDAWDALEKAAAYRPTAFHVIAMWSFRTAATLVRYPPGIVVFDNTDQLAGMVRESYLRWKFPWQVGMERYCLENADGLRCRDMSSQFARRTLGYQIRGKRILFSDYGWGNCKEPQPLQARDLSVVFCGSMSLEKNAPRNRYDHYLELVKAITSRSIPFHLYPTISIGPGGFEDTLSDYFDWAKQCPDLHIHRPVPPQTMASELSRYAVALFIFGNLLHLGPDDILSLLPRKDYNLGSRFFDYVEAGVAILAHDGKYTDWLVRRYGLGFRASTEVFSRPREWLTEQIGRLRRHPGIEEAWTMPRQIERLENFYRTLASKPVAPQGDGR